MHILPHHEGGLGIVICHFMQYIHLQGAVELLDSLQHLGSHIWVARCNNYVSKLQCRIFNGTFVEKLHCLFITGKPTTVRFYYCNVFFQVHIQKECLFIETQLQHTANLLQKVQNCS